MKPRCCLWRRSGYAGEDGHGGKLLAGGFHKGDLIVVTMGTPIETRGSTNLMKVHQLGTHGFYEVFEE